MGKIITSILIGLGVGILYAAIHIGLHLFGIGVLGLSEINNWRFFVTPGIFILGFIVGIMFYMMREKR